MPRISSSTDDVMDTWNYWHVASCSNIRDMWIIGQDCDEIKDYLNSAFNKEFADSIMAKVNTFNDYQLQQVWTTLCFYPHDGFSKEQVSKLVDYYVTYPAEDSRDHEIVEAYAKYICDILDRRDVLNEDYLLARLDSISKMQMLLDKITQRMPSLQCEAIMEDIDIINREVNKYE